MSEMHEGGGFFDFLKSNMTREEKRALKAEQKAARLQEHRKRAAAYEDSQQRQYQQQPEQYQSQSRQQQQTDTIPRTLNNIHNLTFRSGKYISDATGKIGSDTILDRDNRYLKIVADIIKEQTVSNHQQILEYIYIRLLTENKQKYATMMRKAFESNNGNRVKNEQDTNLANFQSQLINEMLYVGDLYKQFYDLTCQSLCHCLGTCGNICNEDKCAMFGCKICDQIKTNKWERIRKTVQPYKADYDNYIKGRMIPEEYKPKLSISNNPVTQCMVNTGKSDSDCKKELSLKKLQDRQSNLQQADAENRRNKRLQQESDQLVKVKSEFCDQLQDKSQCNAQWSYQLQVIETLAEKGKRVIIPDEYLTNRTLVQIISIYKNKYPDLYEAFLQKMRSQRGGNPTNHINYKRKADKYKAKYLQLQATMNN